LQFSEGSGSSFHHLFTTTPALPFRDFSIRLLDTNCRTRTPTTKCSIWHCTSSRRKRGGSDPTTFDDRYDAALVELVKAKMEGRKITPPKAPEPTKPFDLMEALP
jgi:hypothetical protein